jgi:hypothetical protein
MIKKFFILTKHHTPKVFFFDPKVYFWSWHSYGIQINIIKSGNLRDSLRKNNINYLILSKDLIIIQCIDFLQMILTILVNLNKILRIL